MAATPNTYQVQKVSTANGTLKTSEGTRKERRNVSFGV